MSDGYGNTLFHYKQMPQLHSTLRKQFYFKLKL